MSREAELEAEVIRLRGIIARNNERAGKLRDEVIRLRAENGLLREQMGRRPGAAFDDVLDNFLRGVGRR